MPFFKVLFLVGGLMLLGGCASTGEPSLPSDDSVAGAMKPEATTTDLFHGPPQWPLGRSWEYSDGYGLRVIEADGNRAVLERTDKDDSWVRRDGLFKMDSLDDGIRRQVIYRYPNPETFFPLAVGKTVSFAREYLKEKKLHVHKTSWRVVGRETIEVPAGVFDCWVLVWDTRSQRSNWSGYEKWWYSPEVSNYVRLEYRYGKAPNLSRVLMTYQ